MYFLHIIQVVNFFLCLVQENKIISRLYRTNLAMFDGYRLVSFKLHRLYA